MGKLKSRRYKFHISTKEPQVETLQKQNNLPISSENDVFNGVDFTKLFNDKPDDLQSVRSYISNKSLKGDKILPKKDKLKLRRDLFLKKIDTVNQLKIEHKKRNKKKVRDNILSDTKSLLDSLPSLEPLLKMKNKPIFTRKLKKKAVEKSKKIQKSTVQNVNHYKKLLQNPKLIEDPFTAISNHLKALVEEERKEIKK